jgi:hypothetical protein
MHLLTDVIFKGVSTPFERRNDLLRMRFRSTFQGCEYRISVTTNKNNNEAQASYKSMLVKHMHELYSKGLQTDIRVIVNDRENILLHSVVVGHHSEFFATSSLTPSASAQTW